MVIVAVFVFLMLRLTPGDPAAIIAGDNANRRRTSRASAAKLGLDQPIVAQFVIWIGNMLHGDFGESFFFKKHGRRADRRPPRADAVAGALHHRAVDR